MCSKLPSHSDKQLIRSYSVPTCLINRPRVHLGLKHDSRAIGLVALVHNNGGRQQTLHGVQTETRGALLHLH